MFGLALAPYNAWLKELEQHLQTFQHRFDVQLIEVKGHCYRAHGHPYDYRKFEKIVTGQLGKVPRQICDRLDEFTATTQVDVRSFSFPEVQQPAATTPATFPKLAKVVGSIKA